MLQDAAQISNRVQSGKPIFVHRIENIFSFTARAPCRNLLRFEACSPEAGISTRISFVDIKEVLPPCHFAA